MTARETERLRELADGLDAAASYIGRRPSDIRAIDLGRINDAAAALRALSTPAVRLTEIVTDIRQRCGAPDLSASRAANQAETATEAGERLECEYDDSTGSFTLTWPDRHWLVGTTSGTVICGRSPHSPGCDPVKFSVSDFLSRRDVREEDELVFPPLKKERIGRVYSDEAIATMQAETAEAMREALEAIRKARHEHRYQPGDNPIVPLNVGRFLQAVDRILTDLPDAQPATGEREAWRPIESAPSSVDILGGVYVGTTWRTCVFTRVTLPEALSGGTMDVDWHWGPSPTHWMPLPEPPSAPHASTRRPARAEGE